MNPQIFLIEFQLSSIVEFKKTNLKKWRHLLKLKNYILIFLHFNINLSFYLSIVLPIVSFYLSIVLLV